MAAIPVLQLREAPHCAGSAFQFPDHGAAKSRMHTTALPVTEAEQRHDAPTAFQQTDRSFFSGEPS